MDKRERTRRIKDQARALGFEAVGIAPISAMPGEALEAWLARQYHGTMAYMERTSEKRIDPRKVLPSARSMVSLSLNYFHDYELPYQQPEQGTISRYASGEDYHDVLGKRL